MQARRHGRIHAMRQPIDTCTEVILPGDDHLGGRGGCRCAEIGDEVGDRDVGLMPDG